MVELSRYALRSTLSFAQVPGAFVTFVLPHEGFLDDMFWDDLYILLFSC